VDHWVLVILKELVDAALDAAEEASTAPTIAMAVTPAQIQQYRLPTAPPKATDNRAFDGQTCQAEALAPDVLANILRTAIEQRIDQRVLDRVMRHEQRIRRKLITRFATRSAARDRAAALAVAILQIVCTAPAKTALQRDRALPSRRACRSGMQSRSRDQSNA